VLCFAGDFITVLLRAAVSTTFKHLQHPALSCAGEVTNVRDAELHEERLDVWRWRLHSFDEVI